MEAILMLNEQLSQDVEKVAELEDILKHDILPAARAWMTKEVQRLQERILLIRSDLETKGA